MSTHKRPQWTLLLTLCALTTPLLATPFNQSSPAERLYELRLKEAETSLEAGRARLHQRARLAAKSTGEEFGEYDVTRITASFVLRDFRLPRSGTFSVTLTSQVDRLTQISLLRAMRRPSRVWHIQDGAQTPLEFLWLEEEWRLNISTPPLSEGDSMTVWIRTDLDYMFDDSFGQVEEPTLAHHVGVDQLPVSYDYILSDRFNLITEFEVEAPGVFPNAQGTRAVSGNPENGLGSWRYETETTTYSLAMTITDRPFARYSGRIDMSSPSSSNGLSEPFFGFLASEIINSYTSLVAPFPFERFTISTLSALAGVAIGPQGMILMPEDYWWISAMEDDELQWALEYLMAHEIGHQYFPHLVHLQQLAPNWLSEAFAELLAGQHLFTVYEHDYQLAQNHWRYMYYPGPSGRPEPSVVSDELYELDLEDYFVILYLRGSSILHQLSRRYENFPEVFRSYVEAHQGRLVNTEDWINTLSTVGVPNPLRPLFRLDDYLNRALFGVERHRAQVTTAYVDDASSQVQVTLDRPLQDSIELELRGGQGAQVEARSLYLSLAEPVIHIDDYQAMHIDPNREHFLDLEPALPADVDLNGVVDGLDILEVLAREGLNIYGPPRDVRGNPKRYSSLYDLDEDGELSSLDAEPIISQLGSVNLLSD